MKRWLRRRQGIKRVEESHVAISDVAARGAIHFASEEEVSRERIREQFGAATEDELEMLIGANERGIELYCRERGLTSGEAIFDPVVKGMMDRVNVATRLLAERRGIV